MTQAKAWKIIIEENIKQTALWTLPQKKKDAICNITHIWLRKRWQIFGRNITKRISSVCEMSWSQCLSEVEAGRDA